MVTKRTIDIVGGLGSILTGLACLYIAVQDRELHQSMWRVWVVVCAVLVLNGVLMLIVASRTARTHDAIGLGAKQAGPRHV